MAAMLPRPQPHRGVFQQAATAATAAATIDPESGDDVIIINKPENWRRRSLIPTAEPAAAAAAAAATPESDPPLAAEQDKLVLAASKSALLELLSNPKVQPSSIIRFLDAFPVPKDLPNEAQRLLTKQCWEHLLDNLDTDRMENVYGKMDHLRRMQMFCPTELFQQYYRLEQVQLLVDALESQVKAGGFLCQLHRCLSAAGQHSFRPDLQKAQQLRSKLEAADLLMVVHALGSGNVLTLDAQQLERIKIAHLARHGPLSELEPILHQTRQGEQELAAAAATACASSRSTHESGLVNGSFHDFPILFQPLIECHSGWLGRLRALLAAGASAATVYQPWNCSALHMLFYRKSAKVSEAVQVQAIQLLLRYGAQEVLNLADKNSSDAARRSTPTQRTALVQAASAGRFQACRALLAAGAKADEVDSCDQSMLDYLFYLKHSTLKAHRQATADYTCMQLYGMVNEFRLHDLVTDELAQDCRSCGRCRFLLASCSHNGESDQDTDSSPVINVSDSGREDSCEPGAEIH